MNNTEMTKPKLKIRVSRDQWLKKGLEMFALSGSDGLRVEKIARELGISKSGFYCHFQDRNDFLNLILDYWAHEYTEVITENRLLQLLPAQERLLLLMTMVYEENLTDFDAAMDMWSRTNTDVARKRKRVINMRSNFIRNAFEELGFRGDDLEMRTRVLAGFQMGERQIFGFNKKAAKLHRELRLKMLIGEAR
jgi:AcrR family transcriptional regulator